MADLLKIIGKNIRKYRIKKKLSQEALADLSNIHRTYIGQVEAGQRNIAIKNLQKISTALKIPIKKLFE